MFNEFKFSETTKAQIAGRIEQVSLSGVGRSFDAAGTMTSTPASPSYTPKSVSVGLIQNLRLGSRRHHHRAIYRARAEAGRIIFGRRVTTRRRLSTKAIPISKLRQRNRSKSACGAQTAHFDLRQQPTTRGSTDSYFDSSPETPAMPTPVYAGRRGRPQRGDLFAG